MSLLITASILDSYAWFKKCPKSWKSKALKDFSNQLNRVWTEPEPDSPIKIGQAFEKAVERNCNKDTQVGSDAFWEYCQKVKGGVFQKKTKRFFHLDGKEYLFYGKIDVDFPDKIIDMKVTGNYKGESQFLDKTQHRIYLYNERKSDFTYLVAEMEYKRKEIIDIHEINFHIDNPDELFEGLLQNVSEFIKFVESDKDLSDAYYNKFNMF